MPVDVGIVDTPFEDAPGGAPSPQEHGATVAALVTKLAPQARLIDAGVFAGRRAAPERVARGIEECVARGARIVNLSLGLRRDDTAVRCACEEALAAGVIVVAASPARGGPVYPAAYAGVIAACGDARCTPENWSVLQAGRLYGVAPLAADDRTPGGASFAAARVSGLAARYLEEYPDGDAMSFVAWLDTGAAFRGRERRT